IASEQIGEYLTRSLEQIGDRVTVILQSGARAFRMRPPENRATESYRRTGGRRDKESPCRGQVSRRAPRDRQAPLRAFEVASLRRDAVSRMRTRSSPSLGLPLRPPRPQRRESLRGCSRAKDVRY